MSPLLTNTDLVRIGLPAEGEWVEVKRCLSRGDEIAIQKAIAKNARLNSVESVSTFELDGPEAIEAAEFAGLDMAIKAWSFRESVTPQNIRALDPESVAVIKARLNELYERPRTDDERKNLSDSGPTPASAKAGRRRS